MALPQKVIEQLSREPVRTPGWSGGLIMFSGTLFLLSIFIYFGIVYGYKPYLDSEVGKLDNQIKTFVQKVSPDDQAKIISFYSQLVNLKSLLFRHVRTSPLFKWLEENTEENIYYTKFSLNAQTRQLSLSGVAKNISDLADQLQMFQSQPKIQRINFSNVSVNSAGMWQFDLTLVFDQTFFVQGNSAVQ